MPEPDELTRVADIALGRVQSDTDRVDLTSHCHIDHGDIARAGVEEGLKLALRLLHDRFGSPDCLPADDMTARRTLEGSVPALPPSPATPGGNR